MQILQTERKWDLETHLWLSYLPWREKKRLREGKIKLNSPKSFCLSIDQKENQVPTLQTC